MFIGIFGTTIILSTIFSISSVNNNHSIRLRNAGLRFILFNNNKNIQKIKEMKKFYEICYNKSIATIGQYMIELSEDDKQIIEAIISLC